MPNPVPNTDNHNLPLVPPLDSAYADEWGYILNDGEFSDGSDAGSDALVQALEERVVVRDVQAQLTGYTPHADALFFATDTGRIYLGDGTSWTAQSLGSQSDPTPGSWFDSVGLPSGWRFTENADGEVIIVDNGDNVVARRDATAGEWVTDSINADSISTDEVNATHHITEAEANNGIFTAVSDVLQNTDKGVKIQLPVGEFPAGQRLNVRSGASTSQQRTRRAVVIEGSGMINDVTNTSADAGTIVDASGLSGSALYTTGDKYNLHLRNFAINNPTVGIDLSNGRSGGGGIRNVSVNNASSWGFDIHSVFGFYLTNLDSRFNDRSYRFVDCQADSFRNIISRSQTGTAPDIQLTNMGGTEITNLYTEQCAGTMLQIGGDSADGGLTINNMWLENGNQSDQNVPAVLVGDSGLNSNLVNSLTITGGNFAAQTNSYDEWFLLDNCGKVELNGFYTDNPSAPVSVRDTANTTGPLTVINSRLGSAIDLTNIDYTAINSYFDAAERNMFLSDSATIGGHTSTDTLSTLIDFPFNSLLRTKKTTGVDTTATRIFDSTENFDFNCFVLVSSDGGVDAFFDLVMFNSVSHNVISSVQRSGSPPSRTYSVDNENGLFLALSSGTADITAIGITID